MATKGYAAFVQPRYHNQMFAIMDPKRYEENEEKYQKLKVKQQNKILQHCGFEDTVVNHLLLLRELQEEKMQKKTMERREDKSMLSRRLFTVQCI